MKNLMMLGALALFVVWGVGQLDPNMPGYKTIMETVRAEPVQAQEVVQNQTTFIRGNTKNEPIDWKKIPCRDSRSNQYYESEILSREEVVYELQSVGFTGDKLEKMAAITLAESGRQVSCIADEHLTNAKWDVSYGVYSIRAVKAQQGTGSCRDIDRLHKDDFHDQTVCAYEISGQGSNLGPWSTLGNGRYKKYLGQ